jgi:4-oxalocrotonate tautomerase
MPFVSIRMIEGRSQQQKDEIAKRVNDALSDVLQLPKEDIWVVFEDITAKDWYVGSSTVAGLRKKAPT